MKAKLVINVRGWCKRDIPIGHGEREKVVLKRTKRGKVYFMAKSYRLDLGELRAEVCASSLGRALGFPVQRAWFCIIPQYKKYKLPHRLGVLIQLDVRRQKYTKRNQFREDLVHGADLIALVEPAFLKKIRSHRVGRSLYTLERVIRAIRRYISKNPGSEVLWSQFFELLCFDALTGGTDRHYRNWGILQEADTGIFLRLAPAFDNGISLLWKMKHHGLMFQRTVLTRSFVVNAPSLFKKSTEGNYNLYEVVEALYELPELKGTGTARNLLNRLNSVTHKKFKRAITGSVPRRDIFQSGPSELGMVFEYAKMRLEVLKSTLVKLDRNFG